MTRPYSIGDLARACDAKVQTIRHYEAIGLMPPAARTEGGQRRYSQAHLKRLKFIRHARELGFGLAQIRALLELADAPEQPCARADAIAREQLAEVESRIRRLEALRAELARMLRECRGGRVADCRVIEILADHELCRFHHAAEDERKEKERAAPPPVKARRRGRGRARVEGL